MAVLPIAELSSNAWVLAVLSVVLLARSIIRHRFMHKMLTAALDGTKPADRPKIILAMRGLIGRGGPSEPPDDKE